LFFNLELFNTARRKGMERERRILIVDDEVNIRVLLSEELSPIGHVSCCSNGPEALRELKENQLDIVITDFKMPGMDGNELTKKIKNINPGIPVIMLSAVPPPESQADEIVVKSLIFDKLRTSINRLLNLSHSPVLL